MSDAPLVRRINLNQLTIPMDVLKILPMDFMKKHVVVPFEQRDQRISIAIADAQNLTAIDQIRMMGGREVDIFTSPADGILKVLEKATRELDKPLTSPDLHVDVSLGESPVIQIVDKLFEMAMTKRASDIHLEPQARGLFARFRIDGALQTVHQFPKNATAAILSRIKIMATMDISEKRVPQDGKISMKVKDKALDMRVSTLPSKYGEKTVIRLLDKSAGAKDMAALGLSASMQSQFETVVDKPQGLVLVTGPTGSGKSTTLYAVINRLKSPMKNIITLEDPIEFELLNEANNESGVTQVQINQKVELTFAAGLRAALRQDPDVIMVGEIRDQETAEVSMKAAMTGHLVLSTLHTNDTPSAVGRLRDIGIEPYLIASTVTGIMAQRLLRLLCTTCKEAYHPPARAIQKLFPHHEAGKSLTLYRPKGCGHCGGNGYSGRKGVYELLVMSDPLRQQISENAPTDVLRRTAQSQGMVTLRDSGLNLVYEGLTTVDEVFRHTVE